MLWKIVLMIFGSSQAYFIHTSNRLVDHCVYKHHQCNPHLDTPCCEEYNTCTLVRWNNQNLFACLKTTVLGESCQSDSHCSDLESVICSTDRKVCQCTNNYVAISDRTCAPLLGGFCSENFNCIVSNSVCSNNKCECQPHYMRDSNNACVLTSLGNTCSSDIDCLNPGNAICSENGTCICKGDYKPMNNAVCASFLGGYCKNLNECWPDHSVCINNQCECEYKFTPISREKCQPCLKDNDCNQIHLGSKSIEKAYICLEDKSFADDYRCTAILGKFCIGNEHCSIENSHCIHNTCKCKNGFESKFNRQCVPKLLNKHCESNVDCGRKNNLVCSNDKKCVCDQGFVEVDNQTCAPPLYNYCSETKPCLVENSECISNLCHCKANYWPKSDHECILFLTGI